MGIQYIFQAHNKIMDHSKKLDQVYKLLESASFILGKHNFVIRHENLVHIGEMAWNMLHFKGRLSQLKYCVFTIIYGQELGLSTLYYLKMKRNDHQLQMWWMQGNID